MNRSRIRCPCASAQRAVRSRTPSCVSRTGARAARSASTSRSGEASRRVELGVERRPALPQRLQLVARVVPALELARVVAPALLADAARTGRAPANAARTRGSISRGGREAQRAQPARARDRAHARPQHRGQHRQRADLGAVQRRSTPGRSAISSRWLTVCSIPEHGRGAPGDAHRDAAQRQRGAEVLERLGVAAVDAVGVLEHRIHVRARELDGERRVAVVLADQLRQPPVGGRGVGGEQVAEARRG